jgi:hypothetical protein
VTGALAQLPFGRAAHPTLVGLESLQVVFPPLPSSSDVGLTDLRIPCLRPGSEARLAIPANAVTRPRRSVKRLQRLSYSAFDAGLHPRHCRRICVRSSSPFRTCT